jgi:hypothetical protein
VIGERAIQHDAGVRFDGPVAHTSRDGPGGNRRSRSRRGAGPTTPICGRGHPHR